MTEELMALLGSTEFFSAFDDDARRKLLTICEVSEFDLGDPIAEIETPAQGVYFIVKGRVRMLGVLEGKNQSIDTLEAGDTFAELSALRDTTHQYSYRASGKVTILLFPSAGFASFLKGYPEAESYMTSYAAIKAVGGVVGDIFQLRGKINNEQIKEVVESVGIKAIAAGDTVLKQGSSDDKRLYIVRQGEVQIQRREDDDVFELAALGAGELFGEKACMMRQAQFADVVANTDCTLFVLPEKTVHVLLTHNSKLRDALEERIRFYEKELNRHKRLSKQLAPRLKLDLDSRDEIGSRVIERFALIEQAEEMDCGAACLAMICKHYGVPASLGKLRDMINVGRDGASLDRIGVLGILPPYIAKTSEAPVCRGL
jgi:ATP-binding cassette subfamily B protein